MIHGCRESGESYRERKTSKTKNDGSHTEVDFASENENGLNILPPVRASGRGWKVGDERMAEITKETSEEFIRMADLKNTRKF